MTSPAADADALSTRKRRASRWALYSNTILLVMKVVVGAATGSVAVLAEIVNSGADLVGSLMVYFSVRVSDEPPDETHAYGHGKIENLSGVVTATLVLAGGFATVFECIHRLVHPSRLAVIPWAMGVMLFSSVVNALVSVRLLKVGRETESPALISDGVHLRTDVLTSVGVFVGLGLILVTGQQWWDSVAALGVSVMILRIGYAVGRDAVDTLIDRALPNVERRVLEEVLRRNPSVRGFHRLRTRKSGSQRHADVHVLLDDACTLVEAHDIAEQIEDEMRLALPNLDPMVHPEPHDEEMRHQRESHPDWSS